MTPLATIETERLLLRASDAALAAAVAAHQARNREAHARWNPPLAESIFTAEGQRERLAAAAAAEGRGSEIGWWLCPREDAARVIGHARLSQIARGPFHSAMLGYEIDHAFEGRGLMREALQAVLADVFGARVGLHRVQANVRVEKRAQPGAAGAPGFRARRPGARVPVHRRRLARPCDDRAARAGLARHARAVTAAGRRSHRLQAGLTPATVTNSPGIR